MSENEISIVEAQANDVASIGALIARAFHDDPMSVHVFPDPEKRRKSIAWMMGRCARYGLLYGLVEATEEQTGVAVWTSPAHHKMTLWRMFRAGMLSMPFRLGWRTFRRFYSFGKTSQRMHDQAISGPHWYLFVLAVEPSRQGQGIGGSLLKRGLAWADRDGLPIYLETAGEANLAFYGKHGFEAVDKCPVSGTDAHLWGMLRQPQPAAKEG
ncbi:MAG: GNAT family N-acetyltransferase [Pirellulales bacterium]|nr:GNAT family N-acetyltransferase [Pirellulales bacterium]